MSKRLKHVPEPIESMRARYGRALEGEPYTIARAAAGDRPGLHRKHVFDFESGLRIIVNREQFPEVQAEPFTHFSASLYKLTPLYMEWYRRGRAGETELYEKFCQLAVDHFRQIAGEELAVELILKTPGMGVPHWKVS